MTWETVTPLIEGAEQPEFYEPWTPKIGDRVRVRLSGECQHTYGYALERDRLRTTRIADHGHLDEEQGRTGTVVVDARTHPQIVWRIDAMNQHWWLVEFDVETAALRGSTYAACELELLQP